MNVQPQHVSASLTELAGEGSIPVLSSPRRSHLAFLRVGSAACGNTELKVRHKYGAKRVFKLVIRADFFSQCCLFFLPSLGGGGGGEKRRGLPETNRLCVLCRAVCTYTGQRSGSEARRASEDEED